MYQFWGYPRNPKTDVKYHYREVSDVIVDVISDVISRITAEGLVTSLVEVIVKS